MCGGLVWRRGVGFSLQLCRRAVRAGKDIVQHLGMWMKSTTIVMMKQLQMSLVAPLEVKVGCIGWQGFIAIRTKLPTRLGQ